MPSLRELERRGDYLGLIGEVKGRLGEDRRALADPEIKLWCARRFRNLFLAEAEREPAALAEASRAPSPGAGEERTPRQKLADRFFRNAGVSEPYVTLPAAQIGDVRRTTLVFCPGLLNGMIPIGAFQSALPAVEARYGMRVLRVDAHPVRGCEANVEDLRATVERGLGQASDLLPITEATAIPPGDMVLLGYSKGIADALTLLVRHPEIVPRVRAIVSWAGAVSGSYIANDIYNAVKDVNMPRGRIGEPFTTILKIVAPVVRLEGAVRRLDEYDIKSALRDLTTDVRAAFMEDNRAFFEGLSIPLFNITGATTLLEVPYFQATGVIRLNQFDTDNDMQLIQAQAKLPGPLATDLAMFHAHHWDMAYDAFPDNRRLGSSNLDHPFPKTSAVGALVALLAELGIID